VEEYLWKNMQARNLNFSKKEVEGIYDIQIAEGGIAILGLWFAGSG